MKLQYLFSLGVVLLSSVAAYQPDQYSYGGSAPKPTPKPYQPTPKPYQPTPKPYQPTPKPYKPTPKPYKPTPKASKPYQPPAPTYKPTKPAKKKGELEYHRFWKTVDYCDAELGLAKCMIDCNVVRDFAKTERVAACVESFVQTLCSKLDDTGANSGYVQVTKANCVDDAVVAAMHVIGKVKETTIGADEPAVDLFHAEEPDTFSSIKLAVAMQAMVNYGNCMSSSLLNFADTCDRQSLFNHTTSHCVAETLETCEAWKRDEHDVTYPIELGDILPGYHYNKHYGPAKEHSPQLKALIALISDARSQQTGGLKFDLLQHHHKQHHTHMYDDYHKHDKDVDEHHRHGSGNHATALVCPNSFLPMNVRIPEVDIPGPPAPAPQFAQMFLQQHPKDWFKMLPDLPGLPKDGVSFHFPMDKEYTNKPDKPNSYVDGTPYDPITPADGIDQTCKNWYKLSMMAWFSGEDTGDYCFSIDKYSVEFVESGRITDVHYKEAPAEDAVCRPLDDASSLFPSLGKAIELSDNVAVIQTTAMALNPFLQATSANGCSTCYNTHWAENTICPRHLSRWRMHVRCCKGFGAVQDQWCKQDRSHQPCKKGETKDMPCDCPRNLDLEYSHVVTSEEGHGEIKDHASSLRQDYGSAQMKSYHTWAIMNSMLNPDLTPRQQRCAKRALDNFNVDMDGPGIDMAKGYQEMPDDGFIRDVFEDELPVDDDDEPSVYYKSYYKKPVSALVSADVKWKQIISLNPRDAICYPATCVLSKYIDCSEQAVAGNHADYHDHKHKDDYRAVMLLASEASVTSMSVGAFVAGVVVIAVLQLIVKQRRNNAETATPYNQLL